MQKKSTELKKERIEQTVMERIAQKKVQMKPRWYFILGSVLLSSGFLGISVLALFLLNLSFFFLRSHGPMAEWRLQLMLESFPWYIPVLAVFTLIGGVWYLKKYDFSYRHNFTRLSVGFILALLVAALFIDATGINEYWIGKGRKLRMNQGKQQSAEELDQEIVHSLQLALTDERNAHSTYQAVIDHFGPVKPFVNILRAEEQHISALLRLFEKYNLEVPTDTTRAPQLPPTLKEACAMGADAEVANYALYQKMLKNITQEDIRVVFTSLADASKEKHLPAFQRCSNENSAL